jgi:HSP20 family protein
MARQTRGSQQRDEISQEGSGTTAGNVSTSTNRAATETARSDRERGIQTGREAGTTTGMARRYGTSPVYGAGLSAIASPVGVVRRMAEDMDRLIDSFGFSRMGLGLSPAFGTGLNRDLWSGSSALDQPLWSPQVDTFRRGDKLVIRADLPGLSKDDVKVEFDDGVLTISGERSEQHEIDRDDFYRNERTYGQFFRAIPLPEGIDADKSEATFNDGVLEVTLPAPKETERKAKQIQIR